MSAILYDTDSTFDISRFCHLLSIRISDLFPLADDAKHAELQQASLTRLHIFRPRSLPQLATSLKYLPSYHASHMPDDEIGLLAIDSTSAFYWPELLYEEQLRNFAPKKPGSKTETLDHVLNAINSIIRSHAPLVLLTNWGLRVVSQDQSTPTVYKQHLRPFPVLRGSDVTSADRPLELAHHISLFHLSSTLHPNTGPDMCSGQDLSHGNENSHRVVCLITSSRGQEMSRCQLTINSDRILLE